MKYISAVIADRLNLHFDFCWFSFQLQPITSGFEKNGDNSKFMNENKLNPVAICSSLIIHFVIQYVNCLNHGLFETYFVFWSFCFFLLSTPPLVRCTFFYISLSETSYTHVDGGHIAVIIKYFPLKSGRFNICMVTFLSSRISYD